MTITELKARAYDLIALKEGATNDYERYMQPIQNELNQINQEITSIYEAENKAKAEAAKADNAATTKNALKVNK